jgi:myo-inositol-1(or 4)-monophosphatase
MTGVTFAHEINPVMLTESTTQLVLHAVRQVGDAFLTQYRQTPVPHNMAALQQQLDQIDRQCVPALQAAITPAFPNTPWIIGDEFDRAGQQRPLDQPHYWLCDAMDGAIQYLQHLPGWSINLVLIRDGQPHLSVVYSPLEGDLFWAERGAGAYLNGEAIRPSDKTDPAVMLAVVEYGHQDETDPLPDLNQRVGRAVTHLLNHVGIVRNYGPHGLQLASVGAGRVDLFYQPGLDTFNWLAGLLIAQEAGARILTTEGHPWQWGDQSLLVIAPGAATALLSDLVSQS